MPMKASMCPDCASLMDFPITVYNLVPGTCDSCDTQHEEASLLVVDRDKALPVIESD